MAIGQPTHKPAHPKTAIKKMANSYSSKDIDLRLI